MRLRRAVQQAKRGTSRHNIQLSPYIKALGLGKTPSFSTLYRLWDLEEQSTEQS